MHRKKVCMKRTWFMSRVVSIISWNLTKSVWRSLSGEINTASNSTWKLPATHTHTHIRVIFTWSKHMSLCEPFPWWPQEWQLINASASEWWKLNLCVLKQKLLNICGSHKNIRKFNEKGTPVCLQIKASVGSLQVRPSCGQSAQNKDTGFYSTKKCDIKETSFSHKLAW